MSLRRAYYFPQVRLSWHDAPFCFDPSRPGLADLPDEVFKILFSHTEKKKPINYTDSAGWKMRTVTILLGKLRSAPAIAQVSSRIRSILIPLHYGMIYITPESAPVAAGEADMATVCFTVPITQLGSTIESAGAYKEVMVQVSTSPKCRNAFSGGFASFVDHLVVEDDAVKKTLIFRLEMIEARSCFRYLDLPGELRNRIYDMCVPKQESLRNSHVSSWAISAGDNEIGSYTRQKHLKNLGDWLEDVAEQIHKQLSRAYPLSQVSTQLRSEYLAIFSNVFRFLVMIKPVQPLRGESAHDSVWNSGREALYDSKTPLFRKFRFAWLPNHHLRPSFASSIDIEVDLAQSVASVALGAPWLNVRPAGSTPGNIVAKIVLGSIIPLRAHLAPLLWKAELKSMTVGDLSVTLKDLCQAWRPILVEVDLPIRLR